MTNMDNSYNLVPQNVLHNEYVECQEAEKFSLKPNFTFYRNNKKYMPYFTKFRCGEINPRDAYF